jgi:steroid delta-isomerase-like uncharacterized protein
MYSQIRNISIACITLIALGGFFETASADEEANKAIMQGVEEFWNTGNLAIADEIFATDFVYHNPVFPDVVNLESYKGLVVGIVRTDFPDIHLTVEDMLAEGDKGVIRWTFTGTHLGQGALGPPSGRQVTVTGMTLYRFADGKIVESWWAHDAIGMMQQLGFIPPWRETYTWGVPAEVTGDPGDPETNKAIMQRVEEFWNTGNLAIADDIFATDFVWHNPVFPDFVNLESFKGFVVGVVRTDFPDLHFTVEDMVAEGDKVVIRWTFTGTHLGEREGGLGPPSGRQITITGMFIHRFADGKIVESWWAYDVLGMMEQLTAPEWPAQGIWITTVPTPMGNMIIKSTWVAQDAAQTRLTGEFEQINTYPVLIDVYPDSEQVKFAGALAQKIGLNKYEMTAIEYFTKTVGPSLEEIVGIGIVAGTFELIGPDLVQGQGTGAYYMPEQDIDQDGFPDEGQEPVVCVPWEWTAKRLTTMAGCVPTPLPEGE